MESAGRSTHGARGCSAQGVGDRLRRSAQKHARERAPTELRLWNQESVLGVPKERKKRETNLISKEQCPRGDPTVIVHEGGIDVSHRFIEQ